MKHRISGSIYPYTGLILRIHYLILFSAFGEDVSGEGFAKV